MKELLYFAEKKGIAYGAFVTVSYENVWRYKQATPDAMRMYVNKLRSKTYHKLIVNIQGYGYKLEISSCEDR